MSKLLVNAPTGNQEVVTVSVTGGYFDPSRVIWDERTDGTLPSVTLGGMVRNGGALEFSQSLYNSTYPLADLKAAKKLAVTELYREKSELPLTIAGVPYTVHDSPLVEMIGAKMGGKASRKFVTKSGHRVTATGDQINAIFDAIDTHKQLLRDREYDLHEAVDNAANESALNAINIAAGWPN